MSPLHLLGKRERQILCQNVRGIMTNGHHTFEAYFLTKKGGADPL